MTRAKGSSSRRETANRRAKRGAYAPNVKSALALRLVCSGLEAGLVPADAVRRATDAFDQLRRHLRANQVPPNDQAWLEHMLCAALRSRGSETGYVLAVRVVEALRLIREWGDRTQRKVRRKTVQAPPMAKLFDVTGALKQDTPLYPLGDNDPMHVEGLK